MDFTFRYFKVNKKIGKYRVAVGKYRAGDIVEGKAKKDFSSRWAEKGYGKKVILHNKGGGGRSPLNV